jgi:hypothetical protein
VSGAAHVDDRRVDGADVLDVDAQAAASSREEAGEEHVGGRRQLEQDVPALLGAEVDRHAAFPSIGVLDGEVGAAAGDEARRHQAALRVAAFGVFDLQHVGAPLGEDTAGHGHVGPRRHLEHADPAHDSRHTNPFRRACAHREYRVIVTLLNDWSHAQ